MKKCFIYTFLPFFRKLCWIINLIQAIYVPYQGLILCQLITGHSICWMPLCLQLQETRKNAEHTWSSTGFPVLLHWLTHKVVHRLIHLDEDRNWTKRLYFSQLETWVILDMYPGINTVIFLMRRVCLINFHLHIIHVSKPCTGLYNNTKATSTSAKLSSNHENHSLHCLALHEPPYPWWQPVANKERNFVLGALLTCFITTREDE